MGSSMKYVLLCCVLVLIIAEKGRCDDTALQIKCSQEFTKLTSCLDYSTAKADAPSKQCCDDISGMRNNKPECLCYIIQQTYKGTESLKQLGLQFSRLQQLPSACHLKNTSLSDCPKLLNLTPSSPDYAIFTNSTKASSPPAGASVGASSGAGTSTVSPTSAAGFQKIHFSGRFAIAMILAIVISMF